MAVGAQSFLDNALRRRPHRPSPVLPVFAIATAVGGQARNPGGSVERCRIRNFSHQSSHAPLIGYLGHQGPKDEGMLAQYARPQLSNELSVARAIVVDLVLGVPEAVVDQRSEGGVLGRKES